MSQQQLLVLTPKRGKQKRPQKRVLRWSGRFPIIDFSLYLFFFAVFILFDILMSSGTFLHLLIPFFVIICLVHLICGVVCLLHRRIAFNKMLVGVTAIVFVLSLGVLMAMLLVNHILPFANALVLFVVLLYATVACIMLAMYLGFELLGGIGLVALVFLELITASLLGLSYYWWLPLVMLLSLPALLAYLTARRHAPLRLHRLFAGPRQVLARPALVLMQTIQYIGLTLMLGMLIPGLYKVGFLGQVRFVILSCALILLTWLFLNALLMRSKRAITSTPVYLFLGAILVFCYTFQLSAVGYIVALTATAALYHLLDRFVARRRPALAHFGPALDHCMLAIVLLIPFLCDPLLPFHLLRSIQFTLPNVAYPGPLAQLPWLGWDTLIELAALAMCVVLTASASRLAWRKRRRLAPVPSAWGRPWLLFVSGMLLFWGNALLMLHLYPLVIQPLWSFLTLTLLMLAGAVEFERLGMRWSRPLETLALCGGIITLALCMNLWQALWILLLLFAAVSYSVALYLRRFNWLMLPFSLCLLAGIPLLIAFRPDIVGLLCLLLPALGVGLHYLVFAKWKGVARLWEWPLLGIGLAYTVIICVVDLIWNAIGITSSSVFIRFTFANYWLHLHIPFALELGFFALYWYIVALMLRVKGLLIAATAFAICALLALPSLSDGFHITAIVTLLALCLAPLISLWTSKIWVLSLYSVALLGVLTLQFMISSPVELVIASVVLALGALAWLVEGYIRGERILVGSALTLVGLTLLRALSNPVPVLIATALLLSGIAILIMIKGRNRFQII